MLDAIIAWVNAHILYPFFNATSRLMESFSGLHSRYLYQLYTGFWDRIEILVHGLASHLSGIMPSNTPLWMISGAVYLDPGIELECLTSLSTARSFNLMRLVISFLLCIELSARLEDFIKPARTPFNFIVESTLFAITLVLVEAALRQVLSSEPMREFLPWALRMLEPKASISFITIWTIMLCSLGFEIKRVEHKTKMLYQQQTEIETESNYDRLHRQPQRDTNSAEEARASGLERASAVQQQNDDQERVPGVQAQDTATQGSENATTNANLPFDVDALNDRMDELTRQINNLKEDLAEEKRERVAQSERMSIRVTEIGNVFGEVETLNRRIILLETAINEEAATLEPAQNGEPARNGETATARGAEPNNETTPPVPPNGFQPQGTPNNDSVNPRVATAHPEDSHADDPERRTESRRRTQEQATAPEEEEEEGTTGVEHEPQQSALHETFEQAEIEDGEGRTVERGNSNNDTRPKDNSEPREDDDSLAEAAHPASSRRDKLKKKFSRPFLRSDRWIPRRLKNFSKRSKRSS